MNEGGTATLASLQVGQPQLLQHGAKQVLSGIFKSASEEARKVHVLGIEGDGQGDTVHHGGPDKAICAYFVDRYPYWSEHFGRPFQNGAFGENFTLSNWTEDQIHIGDIVAIGHTVLQVSQPRQPCYKLGLRNGLPELPALAQQTGYTGFYFRVLQEGTVKAGDSVVIVERHKARLTIADANRVMYKDKSNMKAIQTLLDIAELAASWRDQLTARLNKLSSERHE
ncbi:MOSC domain-containing protein [Paenibacillus sp. 1011MAR3C5]|uniref:MOSC domain-containing protein n=1 Tax=Paenibacillus sp. 1011MAR3C5 TaxID=1675787 RepID=UPI000E6C82EB|nr:MOSC domain-containing protein [Paenibacillus sp. 1011MAR3C5]RJE90209.1 MOSC domain-containing protein [Paenibacillus sp. 1011MAR3C5]